MASKSKDENQITYKRMKTHNKPSRDVMEAMVESQRRVNSKQKMERQLLEQKSAVAADEQQYEVLVGQLKSAEARNRLRILRARHSQSAEREVGHLVTCQPTALRAVRLEAMLSSAAAGGSPTDLDVQSQSRMSKADAERVNKLLST